MRFSRNDGVNNADRDGRMLVAIDGTSSSTATSFSSFYKRWNSHVKNFVADYVSPGDKLLKEGPNIIVIGVDDSVEQGYRFVCNQIRKNPSEAVNLVGHSRGGFAVNLLAWKLYREGCSCNRPVAVNFMGLYDAVDMYIPQSAPIVPPNVGIVAHARRDPGARSRPYWGNAVTGGGIIYVEEFFFGAHSAIGGDPGNGDSRDDYWNLVFVTDAEDELASIEADLFVREAAIAAGIRFTLISH